MISSFQISAQFQRNSVVKLSPFEFSRAEFKLSYEQYILDRRHSVLISPTIILKGDEEDQRKGWRAMLQYRYYLSHLNDANGNEFIGISNVGIYAGLYGLYLDYNDKYVQSIWDPVQQKNVISNNERSIKSQEGGAIIGLQVDLTQRFVIDFYVGGGIRNSDTEYSSDEPTTYHPDRGGIFPYDYIGVKPTFGFMLGLLF